MPDIDALRIQVESDAQKAHSGLESLIGTLNKLKQITAGGVGLKTVANQMNAFSQATNSLKSTGAANLIMIVAALKDLNGLRVNLPKSTVNNLQMLGNISTTSLTQTGAANISRFATSLRRIGEVSNVRISAALPKNMTALAEAAMAVQFSGLDPAVFTNVANGLAAFGSVGGGGGLKTTINQLERVPELATKFNTVDIDKFTQKVRSLGTSFKPLSTSVIGLEKSLKTLPASINALANASNKAVQSNSRMSSSFGSTLARVGLAGLSLRALARAVASAINKSNEYVESLNLFNVSMGKYANEAGEYAERVNEVMGIDPASWMKNQGVFQTITEGFGVAADRAYTMSKNLTQLGYDLSSFFNIPFEDAFQKLQSGISGELEPLRRLGYDLSQARLEATAAQLGIEKTFTTMNQAEKAQLRYYAIMTQVTDAQGDMARTLSAPSNQLRILKSQVSQAARAIGNIFIPVLNAILPVAIAAAKGIQIVMSAFASLLGYELPEVDYSGIQGATGAVGGLGDELESAGGAAKELKKYLMGFDEINQIPDLTGGGGGGSIGGGGGSDFDFELPSYDFIGEAVSGKVDQIMDKIEPALDFIKENANTILSVVEGIGASLLLWKLGNVFVPGLTKASELLTSIKGIVGSLVSATITVTVGAQLIEGFFENSDGANLDWGKLLSSGLVDAFGGYITGIIAKKSTGSDKFGSIAFAGTIAFSAGVKFFLNYQDAVADGWDAENTYSAILSTIETAMAGYSLGRTLGGNTGAAIGTLTGLLIGVITWIAIDVKLSSKDAVKLAPIEKMKIRLAAEDVESFVKSQFDFDIAAHVDILDSSIKNVETAKATLNKEIAEFSASLNLVLIGADIDKETVIPALKDKLLGEGGIISSMNTVLEEQQNHLAVLMSITPIKGKDGNEDYGVQLYNALGLSSKVITESVTQLGVELGDLLTESMVRELTSSEQMLVNSISNTIMRVESILAGDQATKEFYAAIGDVQWADLDDESFMQAMDTFNSAISTYRAALYEANKEVLYGLRSNLDSAKLLSVEYNNLLENALVTGDDVGVEIYSKKVAEIEESIASLAKQIENYDIDATVETRIATVVEPILPNVEKRLYEWVNSTYGPMDRNRMYGYTPDSELKVDWVNAVANTGKGIEALNLVQRMIYETNEATNGALLYSKAELSAYEILVNDFKADASEVRKALSDPKNKTPLNIGVEDAALGYARMFGYDAYVNMLKEATTEASKQAEASGEEITMGVAKGMVSGIFADEVEKKLTEAFGFPIKIFNEVNEINSPSKVFERASGFIIDGIVGPLLKLPKALVPVYNVFKATGDLLAGTLTGGIVDKVSSLVENVNSLPTMHALTINIPGYSTVIKRIEAIRDGMRGITSGGAKVNIKVGVDPKSRQFLLTLARVADSSTSSKNLGELLEIDTYAHGGIPDHGELFIANERGPELVGRIGNKSAVANDEQIGDVILSYMERSGGSGGMDEERLASAIARELKAAGIGMVKLDGKTLAQSINRETQRTGRNAITLK